MENITSEIRAFNRFYTSHLEILNQRYLDSSYTLTEVRIMYEISSAQDITAQEICEILTLDKGYLSRILKRLLKEGIIEKVPSSKDKRAFNIVLTALGIELIKTLNDISDHQTALRIEKLNHSQKEQLVDSMYIVKKLLDGDANRPKAKDITYRYAVKPGDIGYIIYLHGLIYGNESIFSNEFEAYVIKTFYQFLEHCSMDKDRLWMAEYNNRIIGCIAIVHQTEEEAQLRWFLLDPAFRGLGIGKKLLNDALNFCIDKQFKSVFLLTTSMQERALDMYKRAGFKLSKSTEVKQWGAAFRDERYDLKL